MDWFGSPFLAFLLLFVSVFHIWDLTLCRECGDLSPPRWRRRIRRSEWGNLINFSWYCPEFVSFIMLHHATNDGAVARIHQSNLVNCGRSADKLCLFNHHRWTIEHMFPLVSSGGGRINSAFDLYELNLQWVIDWLEDPKMNRRKRKLFQLPTELKNIYSTIIKTFLCGRSEVAPLIWTFWRHLWGWK